MQNNQISCAFTGNSRTPLSYCHPHHDNAVLSSDIGAALLAPIPGNDTNDAGCLQWVQNCIR
eukprot:10353942-Ditylum_brightwellii.AAC.1